MVGRQRILTVMKAMALTKVCQIDLFELHHLFIYLFFAVIYPLDHQSAGHIVDDVSQGG